MAIFLHEIVNKIYEETVSYPLAAFLPDTGGAAGLFLGLNVIGVLKSKFEIFSELFQRIIYESCYMGMEKKKTIEKRKEEGQIEYWLILCIMNYSRH